MARGTIYTVHEKPEAKEPSDRIVLVREGFSLWAFVFHILWLLAHRCWRMAFAFAGLMLLVDFIGRSFDLSTTGIGLLQLGLQFWLGCVANDCRRASLARIGYDEISVVCAETELLAERRYFDRLHPAV